MNILLPVVPFLAAAGLGFVGAKLNSKPNGLNSGSLDSSLKQAPPTSGSFDRNRTELSRISQPA